MRTMHCFLFILLFCLGQVFTDVIFTSERCNRVTYGLRTVNGDPSRYKQCGPSGRVWIVPCAPQMTFDPEDRVCKERLDSRIVKPMRKYETSRTIITTPAPIPSSYPVSAEVIAPGAPAASHAAPEEFVFSTIRPKSRKPKAKTRGKFRKTTTAMIQTTTPMTVESFESMEMTTTPKIVIFASKKNMNNTNRSGESRTQLIRNRNRERGNAPAFTRPGRVRTTTPMSVTHATRFVPGIQHKVTVAPKEVQGMPHTLAPYEKMDRRPDSFGVEELTTMTPEYTVRYNGQTMTENEFLNQLLHIVQHQKTVSERQQQEKFEKMEQERLRQEKEEKARELERRRKLEESETARQAELDRQATIYAEQERMAMERNRELERIRLEEKKRENERVRQEEIAMEISKIRELERLQLERQRKNERVRQELEAARKYKLQEEERQRKIQQQKVEMEQIRQQEEARQEQLRVLEEERARELERVRQEELERQHQMEILRQQEEDQKKKKLEKDREQREQQEAEELNRMIIEKEMKENKQKMIEEKNKRKMLEKEMEDRQNAIYEEEERRIAEEERRKQIEIEERRRIQQQIMIATEERSRLDAMEREREMLRQIKESEKQRKELERQELLATTPITTIKPIYRPDISEYRPPDVESHMIRFTTQSPEWATPSPTWNPAWNITD